jgi:hypothetical protein
MLIIMIDFEAQVVGTAKETAQIAAPATNTSESSIILCNPELDSTIDWLFDDWTTGAWQLDSTPMHVDRG